MALCGGPFRLSRCASNGGSKRQPEWTDTCFPGRQVRRRPALGSHAVTVVVAPIRQGWTWRVRRFSVRTMRLLIAPSVAAVSLGLLAGLGLTSPASAQAPRTTRTTVLPTIDRRTNHDRQMRDSASRILRRAGGLVESLPAAALDRDVAGEATTDVVDAKRTYRQALAEERHGHFATAVQYAQLSIEAAHARQRTLGLRGTDVTQVSAGEAPPSVTPGTIVVTGLAPTVDVRATASTIVAPSSTIVAGPNSRVLRYFSPPQNPQPFGVVPTRPDSLPFGAVPAGPGVRESYITHP